MAAEPALAPLRDRLRLFPAVDLNQGLGMLRSLGLAAVSVAAQDQTLSHRRCPDAQEIQL